MLAIEPLHEEAQLLELKVSYPMNEVKIFGGLLDETEQFVRTYGGLTE